MPWRAERIDHQLHRLEGRDAGSPTVPLRPPSDHGQTQGETCSAAARRWATPCGCSWTGAALTTSVMTRTRGAANAFLTETSQGGNKRMHSRVLAHNHVHDGEPDLPRRPRRVRV
jgi:hypothetical protein